jgi:hypothetical protein
VPVRPAGGDVRGVRLMAPWVLPVAAALGAGCVAVAAVMAGLLLKWRAEGRREEAAWTATPHAQLDIAGERGNTFRHDPPGRGPDRGRGSRE